MPAPAPWAKTKQAVASGGLVSRAETDVVLPTPMVSRWVIQLKVSEQQDPVVLFHDRLDRHFRRDAEAAQEIAVDVALALHGVAGEEVVEHSLVGCRERGVRRGAGGLQPAGHIGQCAGTAAE